MSMTALESSDGSWIAHHDPNFIGLITLSRLDTTVEPPADVEQVTIPTVLVMELAARILERLAEIDVR